MRRVETLRFRDASSVERSITLDVDTDALAERYRRFHRLSRLPRELTIPLATIERQLLLDIDLTDDAGRRLHAASRQADSDYAARALWGMHGRATPDVYRACREVTGRPGVDWPEDPADLEDNGMPEWYTNCYAQVRRGATQQFAEWFAHFTNRFVLPVRVPLGRGVIVLKLRLVEAVRPKQISLAARLGGVMNLPVDMPDAFWCDSDHFRVHAPPGLLLTTVAVEQANQGPVKSPSFYWGRLTMQRAHLYTWGDARSPGAGGAHVPTAHYTATLRLRLMPHGWISTARVSLALIGVLLTVGALLMHCVVAARDTNADAAVALLLLAPSAMSTFLVRGEEHPMFEQMAATLRGLVLAASLTPIPAAGAFVLGADEHLLRVIWSGLGASTLCVAAFLARVFAESRRAAETVTAGARRTEQGTAVIDAVGDKLRYVLRVAGRAWTARRFGLSDRELEDFRAFRETHVRSHVAAAVLALDLDELPQ